jgi:hypothetical protein
MSGDSGCGRSGDGCYRGLAITCLTASYATWWFVMMRPGAVDDYEIAFVMMGV